MSTSAPSARKHPNYPAQSTFHKPHSAHLPTHTHTHTHTPSIPPRTLHAASFHSIGVICSSHAPSTITTSLKRTEQFRHSFGGLSFCILWPCLIQQKCQTGIVSLVSLILFTSSFLFFFLAVFIGWRLEPWFIATRMFWLRGLVE